MKDNPQWSVGSVWQRWDPHLHAPGTVLEDRFASDWDGYCQAIAEADPKPVALGITDYCSLDSYERVMSRRSAPPFDTIPFIFPNVEIRLALPADRNRAVNAHLLIDPDSANHIQEAKDILAQLWMPANGGRVMCRRDKLIDLGRVSKGSPTLEEEAALREGTTQFRVELGTLVQAIRQSSWARSHVLLAVAGGKDGLSGLRRRDGWSALVRELSREADILFSATPTDIGYWQGDPHVLAGDGYSPKPCLHGSDAHEVAKVLRPDEDRYCWLRTGASFEGLRQAIAEPARRVHIGALPREGAPRGEQILRLDTQALGWIRNTSLEFNPGLVTIIGARGSGKTAVADLLAYGAFAEDAEPGSAAFLNKASQHVEGDTFSLEWGDEDKVNSTIAASRSGNPREPRVRYLSQQFVEQLCNPTEGRDRLVDELDRVVFQSLGQESQKGCGDFAELRRLELEQSQTRRRSAQRQVAHHTEQIADLAQHRKKLPGIKSQIEAVAREIAGLEKEVSRAPASADPTVVAQQKAVHAELSVLVTAVAAEARSLEELGHLTARVDAAHAELERTFAELREKYGPKLGEDAVSGLKVTVAPGIPKGLRATKEKTDRRLRELRDRGRGSADLDATLKGLGVDALEKLNASLIVKLNIGAQQAKRLAKAQAGVSDARRRMAALQAEQTAAAACTDQISREAIARLAAYRRVLDELDAEQSVLEKLYGPLRHRIEADERLSKLSFAVSRRVDSAAFIKRGASLFIERKVPGEDGLEALLKPLLDAWVGGEAAQSHEAMTQLLAKHSKGLLDALRPNASPLDFGRWLFSTEHLSIEYRIRYENSPLEHLSPGTRGVVLLTLFLGVDIDDGRPLVIDQPEENLDPKSVYDDLAPFFREAATRRQIIMVTHNANLVINTDADQIIVATAHRSSPEALPEFTYTAGGLEDREIRRQVCSILEGGAEAFERRSRRYDALGAN